MKKQRSVIKTADLVLNDGRLGWLPRNPRDWTKEDLEDTKASLVRDPDFLEDRPIIVVPAGKKYLAFCGNLRLSGVKALGWKEVEVVVYLPSGDDYDQEERETIKRRTLLDNGEYGHNNYDILADEWDDMEFKELGIRIPGLDVEEPKRGEVPEAQEDDFDEEKDEIHVLCKPGDIWELGGHRLKCGDSVDLQQVKELMGGVLADMVFTDPPYGVAIGDKNAMLNTVQKAGRCCENIKNDTLSVDELYKVLTQCMANVRENCKDDASYYVAAPPGGDFGLMMMMMMMQDAGLRVRHQLVWNKDAATFSLGRLDYDYKHEAIMYTWTKSHHNYRTGKYRTSVWDIPKVHKCDLHPTMKPIELVANCILDCTKEGDVVLDSFGGSGTTLIACEQLGRKCYMMELDPHYCDVIIARWEKLTGQKARKLN